MFDFIRTHRRWMQFILLLLVVPAFAFFGIEGYVGFMSKEKELALVDGTPITQPEFDAAHRARLEELRGMLGAQFDAQAIDTPAFRERLLNEMIDQRVITTAAMQGRYSVSDEQLREMIARIPALQENGTFSPEKYRQVLAAQGMTASNFELRVRSDLILSQVLGPIGATAAPPKKVIDELVSALTQQRTVAVRRFSASAYESDVKITEMDIKQWYEKNSESLRLPESVDVQYVLIDEQVASKGITVPEAEVQKYYEQNKARYGQPQRRRVSHILREVPAQADQASRDAAKAKAQEIATRLKTNPDQFAALAKEFSQDPGSADQGGDLGWISKDTLVPEVETEVFKIEPGKISDVIQSPFGYHVIVVKEVQPASIKPLEQVRADVESEIKRQLAAARFAELTSGLTNLVYDQRDALAPIAKQLGLTLHQVSGLSRGGLLPSDLFIRDKSPSQAEMEVLNNPKVIQAAYSNDVLKDKSNSGVIEIEPGKVVALRVVKINPSVIPAMAQLEPLIKKRLTQEKSLSMAREAAKAALAVISDASKPAMGFSAPEVVSRQDPRNLNAVELDAVMKVAADQVPKTIGTDTREGYSLLQIQAVMAGKPMPEANLNQFRTQLAQAWGRAEEAASLQILRQVFNTQITPDGRAVIAGESIGTGS